ncbi:MAG: GTPase ObgE [Saprospiraceae bacterium]|nr:GTPase ObgE [Saprospiraceae bacterium]MBP7679913.1 GTPase ObgE [Saprospiraceae bacterium]
MTEQNFIDYVKIHCKSGKGGAGSIHFHRAKFVPKGGPDGGDGGQGGHIILKGNRNIWTLLSLKYRKHIAAEDGKSGSGNNCSGANGNDVIIEVPLGTVAKNGDTQEFLMEITEHDQTAMLMKGGRGGLGNNNFKTSTNQTPRYAQPGEPAEESWVILELKTLADVGLVGFPNAGKSTLLSVLSAAKPEIAPYPFTTIVPQLGIVQYRDGRSFVMADIPGIIEDAHLGKGLGHRFLRHIERNATLLFMIPCDSDDIKKDYKILVNELKQYNPELLDKPRLLAITKCDMMDEIMIKQMKKELPRSVQTLFISAVSGLGITELKDALWETISAGRANQVNG